MHSCTSIGIPVSFYPISVDCVWLFMKVLLVLTKLWFALIFFGKLAECRNSCDKIQSQFYGLNCVASSMSCSPLWMDSKTESERKVKQISKLKSQTDSNKQTHTKYTHSQSSENIYWRWALWAIVLFTMHETNFCACFKL